VETHYVEVYRELYERHWWWRAREDVVVDALDALRPDRDWGDILDVGCGDALIFPRLSSFGSLEGVESDARLLSDETRARFKIHVRPFDETFDTGRRYGLILFLDVLEHVSDPVALLGGARRLLAPGGRVLITVPAFRILWTHHDALNQHLTRYRKAELAEQVRRAGLTLTSLRYFSHWTFPAKLLVRAKERLMRPQDVPPGVPPRAVNETLYRLSRFEERLLRPLRLPFGSSLLGVAGAGP